MSEPLPVMQPKDGWHGVPIEPVDEPLVAVADISPRIHDDPRYHAMGLVGALESGMVRSGVAERLARASESLPAGYDLLIWDGYRPFELQKAIYDQYLNELIAVHPEWPHDALEDAAARYVTPPSRSEQAPAPHLTGGAVDLTLCTPDGEPHELGTGFDAFVPEAGARALEDAPGAARDHRRLLFWAMHEQGFTNYTEEWWHYDRGDQFWGLIAGCPAIYGPAETP